MGVVIVATLLLAIYAVNIVIFGMAAIADPKHRVRFIYNFIVCCAAAMGVLYLAVV
jgi:hypothetical protein